ncbi:YcnI family copper-binding membrane protein [Effusibacillus pohliae]|uniref:YcnI family copper-binding membrane protein n=1 Tax=Effusibacillus pohliae TaxID=232270 RepID=UPI000381A4EE|nr:YcnI family protein [Effusibacillus pohliae]
MNMKKWMGSLAVAGTLLALTGTASAHVTVWPKETTTGAYEKYTVRVPVEKDINTTKVRVEFPQGVSVSTVQPTPGWNYEFEKDADGRFKAITWTSTAGGLKPHEFTEFSFVAKNPKDPGTFAWKAYQTYADGSVVEWTGAPDSKTPASVTTVKQGAAQGDQHDEKQDEHNHAAPAPDTTASAKTGNTLPLVVSGAALLISLISLFRKKE